MQARPLSHSARAWPVQRPEVRRPAGNGRPGRRQANAHDQQGRDLQVPGAGHGPEHGRGQPTGRRRQRRPRCDRSASGHRDPVGRYGIGLHQRCRQRTDRAREAGPFQPRLQTLPAPPADVAASPRRSPAPAPPPPASSLPGRTGPPPVAWPPATARSPRAAPNSIDPPLRRLVPRSHPLVPPDASATASRGIPIGPQGDAVGHTLQPSPQRVLHPERANPASQDEERGLEGILGVAGVADDASTDRQDHRPMSCHHAVKASSSRSPANRSKSTVSESPAADPPQ